MASVVWDASFGAWICQIMGLIGLGLQGICRIGGAVAASVQPLLQGSVREGVPQPMPVRFTNFRP